MLFFTTLPIIGYICFAIANTVWRSNDKRIWNLFGTHLCGVFIVYLSFDDRNCLQVKLWFLHLLEDTLSFSVSDLTADFYYYRQYYRILLETQQILYIREVLFHYQINFNLILFFLYLDIAIGRYSRTKQFVPLHVYISVV